MKNAVRVLNESEARRKSGRAGIKRKTVTIRLPLSCILWLKSKAQLFDLTLSEILQCSIVNAASAHFESTLMDQITALKMAKKKMGKHHAMWVGTSIPGLRSLDIACAAIYGVHESDLLAAWLVNEAAITLSRSEFEEEQAIDPTHA